MIDRRRFLLSLGALAAAPAFPQSASIRSPSASRRAIPRPRASCSGRASLGALARRGAGAWEIASDESMKTIVRSGTSRGRGRTGRTRSTSSRRASQPDRWYWYRFTAGDAQSPIGRTRTAPGAAAQPSRLRFAFASCQHYEQGYFGAYRHMVADDPDLIVFLGDYIYESQLGPRPVRSHDAPEPYTLDDYRARYALYKTRSRPAGGARRLPLDRDLGRPRGRQRLRRRPARGRHGQGAVPRAPRRRLPRLLRAHAAARAHAAEGPGHAHLHHARLGQRSRASTRSTTASTARGRPARAPGAAAAPTPSTSMHCARLASPGRTHARARAGALARRRASANRARAWNVLAQQTPMAQFDQKPGPGPPRLDRRLGRLSRRAAAPLRFHRFEESCAIPS